MPFVLMHVLLYILPKYRGGVVVSCLDTQETEKEKRVGEGVLQMKPSYSYRPRPSL